MNILPFNTNIKQQMHKIVAYANNNIYEVDDILDMMNSQMEVPGSKPEHLLLVPIGLWICYYIVEHPEYGLSHYFTFKPDVSGNFPDSDAMEYILKQFEIEKPLHEKNISINEETKEKTIKIPFV